MPHFFDTSADFYPSVASGASLVRVEFGFPGDFLLSA
jgi:hypothetical protein